MTFLTVDQEICLVLYFYKRVWVLSNFVCIIFPAKYFSNYILLTDQVSLFGSLYFLPLFLCDHINFEINHSFLTKPFFYITKKPGQKRKYINNETRF